MKKLFAVAIGLVLASSALAQGVTRPPREPEVPLVTVYRNSTMIGMQNGGYALPADRGFRITAVTYRVKTAQAAATGTMTFQVTDGTATCVITADCTSTDVTALGAKRITALSGTCTFAPGSKLMTSINGVCGAATPEAYNINYVGVWN